MGNNILDAGGAAGRNPSRALRPVLPSAIGFDAKIAFRDLEFTRVPVLARSSRGVPYIREMPTGMPRIPPKVLDCVCYLYGSEDDACAGREFGGTGFLVSVPSKFAGLDYVYAVTNRHIACQRWPVVRVNTLEGGTDVFNFEPDQWEFDRRYDIAAVPLPVREGFHRFATVGAGSFMTPAQMERVKVGPGDDVFMVGRFMDHDGGLTNLPAVRFGNISVMPSPIKQENIGMAKAFCIDLHSRSGYSGSPVFVYRTANFDLEEEAPKDISEAKLLAAGTTLLMLLGIHFAQFPEEWELIMKPEKPNAKVEAKPRVPLIKGGASVKGLSGMTCVLPAWNIHDILDLPKLKRQREAADARESERRAREGWPPEAEAAKG